MEQTKKRCRGNNVIIVMGSITTVNIIAVECYVSTTVSMTAVHPCNTQDRFWIASGGTCCANNSPTIDNGDL